MSKTETLTSNGQEISHPVGAVRITITRVTATAYNVYVSHNCTGGRCIEELTKSHHTEAQARSHARTVYRGFATGITVQDYLNPQFKEIPA
jgi:hypothetical protein